MDDTDSLCPCLSGRQFARCCGPFEASPAISGEVPVQAAHRSLRHHLLELLEHVPDLQEIWFSFADDLPGPLHDVLPGHSLWELEQARMELFLWDYFQKISFARPILRVARMLEIDDLRSASRLDDWSLAPWSAYQAVSFEKDAWILRHLTTDKLVHAHLGFEHHALAAGDGLVCRILKHGGHSFTGLGFLRFPTAPAARNLETQWRALCTKMGLPVTITLRPDVHNEQWFPFHRAVLELWAGIAPLRQKKARGTSAHQTAPATTRPAHVDLDQPQAALGNQSPREAMLHAMGKHRLKLWLLDMERQGTDTATLRKSLALE
ncbi:MAG: hypothetical protein RL318_1378 [Fibrobacterota bacterium]|jgi:hypothetical protein